MSIPKTTIVAALAATLILTPFAPMVGAAGGNLGTVIESSRAGAFEGTYTIAYDVPADGSDQLIGGRGASFAYQAWKTILPVYNGQSTNDAAYWSCGSSCGKRAFLGTPSGSDTTAPVCTDASRFAGECSALAQTKATWTIWGTSDAPLTAAQYASATAQGEVLHLPLAVGAVSIVYNLASCQDDQVDLTPAQVSALFTGAITRWNDPALRTESANTCLETEDTPVQPVVRCDGSGTTFVFTDWLARTAGAPWTAQEASPMTYSFRAPDMICGNQNPGVSSAVGALRGRVGYVELAQAQVDAALHDKAKIQNGDGTNFVGASEQTATNAADAAAPLLPAAQADWSGVSIVAATGLESYPITSFTYNLVWATPYTLTGPAGAYTNHVTANQYAALKDLLHFVNTDAAQDSLAAGYSKLPTSVRAINEAGIERMHYGARETVSITGLPGSTSVFDQGMPQVGDVGHTSGGVFTPAAYRPVDSLAEALPGEWVELTGTVVVQGPVVLVDNGAVGHVSPFTGIASGVYGKVQGQLLDGTLVVRGVA